MRRRRDRIGQRLGARIQGAIDRAVPIESTRPDSRNARTALSVGADRCAIVRCILASAALLVGVSYIMSCGDSSLVLQLAAGVLCVADRYDPLTQTADVRAGAQLAIEVWPEGCHASSCAQVVEASCSFPDEAELIASARFRIIDRPGDGGLDCTGDCSGVGTTMCEGPLPF